MARPAGVDLPRNKRMEVALTYIYSVGPARANELLEKIGISPDLCTDALTDRQAAALRDVIEATREVEDDPRRQAQADIRRKVGIGSCQGLRHRRGLPVRGQRTKISTCTRKGPKKTIVGEKKQSMAVPKSTCGRRTGRRVVKKNVAQGHTYIESTFNNTIVSITDPKGAVTSQASSGHVGFKGSRKSTPFTAQMVTENTVREVMDHGMKKVDVFAKGPGSGHETVIRSLQATGPEVFSISDVTPQPHNGCRLPKRRRAWEQGEERTEMARYTGPVTRKSRRLRADLVGGDMNFERRPYPPGQAGRVCIKELEYPLQLQEKQRACLIYGVMEKQFRRYYARAYRRPGKAGDNFVVLLESRLDNVAYRVGPARTCRQARQLVSHGHFTVNGEKIDVPSFQVSQYDIVDMYPKS